MEPFLPSEIARLVYGYLDEAKCDEAAQSFLEQCSHLSECLAVNKEGKGFNTRPAGYSLTDILDEYCEIRRMVAECLQKLPRNSGDKLQQCDSLIDQLRYLIDSSQSGQTLLVSIRVPPQELSAKGVNSSVTPTIPTDNQVRIIGSSNRTKRTAVRLAQGTKQQCSKDADDILSSISNSMLSIEATPLENLPGTSGNVGNESVPTGQECVDTQNVSQSGHAAEYEHVDSDGSEISHEANLLKPSNRCQKCCDKGRTSKYQQHLSCVRTNPAVDGAIEDGSSGLSSPKRKHSCSSKRKNANPTPVKSIQTPAKSLTPCKVRRPHSDINEPNENIDFSMLTRALLDNTELHKKIAENINRVIHKPGPEESLENSENHLFSGTAGDSGSAETYPMVAGCNSAVSSCDGVLQELNQTIKTIVEQTQQDPVFERFLDEIIAPVNEELTPSSVDLQSEDDNAFPDLAVTTKPARNVIIDSHNATSISNKKSTSLSSAEGTSCSKDQQQFQEHRLEDSSGMLSNDIPLKQRLRSATQHKSDPASGCTSVNPTASSGKQKKKEGTSLEDQNAAAVQCIVDAKISTQKTFDVSHIHQSQKNDCPSTPTSTVDTQAFNMATSVDSGQLMKADSVVVSTLQKEVSQITDVQDGSVNVGSSDNTKLVNDYVHNTEVILLDASLTFLDNNASFSSNTASISNFVTNPSPVKTQLSAPLIVTPQASVSTAVTNQVVAVTMPGTTNALQQAAAFSGISLHQPYQQAAPHSLATNSSSQVVAITIPGPQNVNQVINDQMSSVIMCGTDGIIPQFITLPQQNPLKGNYLLPGSGGSYCMPIVPRGILIPKARAVHQDVKPGPSKNTRLSISERKKRISSRGEKKVVRNSVGVSTDSQISKPTAVVGVAVSADKNKDNVKLKSPDLGHQSSQGCGLSLPSIILESPETKISITAQENTVNASQVNGQQKLLGTCNQKEASDSALNQNQKGIEQDKGIRSTNDKEMKADGIESIRNRNELLLQNVKFPPSEQLLTLVNISRNLAVSGCSPSAHVSDMTDETTAKKESEVKVAQKPRETPQSTTSQGRTGVNSKRLSLSTPRRQRHIRVLDFTTPPKARTVPRHLQPKEPAPNTVEKVMTASQRSVRDGVNKARSVLFKSPHNESETTISDTPVSTVISSVSSACSNNYHSAIPPIATRSPLPRLIGGWDNAAGVGQIICDESGSDMSVTETRNEMNETDKQSEVSERLIKPLKSKEAGCRVTQKLAEGNLVGTKNLPSLRKAWDSELRACLNTVYEGIQVPSNDSSNTTNKTTKKKKMKTNLGRKSSQVTEEEARSLEEHLSKDEHTKSGSINNNQGSTNGASENTSSDFGIPFNRSLKSSEETDGDIGAKNQNRDINTISANLTKDEVDLSRKNVEPASETDHAYLELVEKQAVKFSNKYKGCVSVQKLNINKDDEQPTDLSDTQGATDKSEVAREADGKEQVTVVQRKEILAVQTADRNKDDLSKSSNLSTMETVGCTMSIGSVLSMASCYEVGQSPTELKEAKRRTLDNNLHIQESPNSDHIETAVSHVDDLGNNTSLVAAASGMCCELEGGPASIADGQLLPVSQNEEPISSTSGFYPSESQNKDFQASDLHKSSFSKEPPSANVPNNPMFNMSGTQKQVCDTVNMSDPQAEAVTASVLDTPRKIDDPSSSCWGTMLMSIPITPRLRSPHSDDTPITKPVDGNTCVSFSLIETPSFPPTPNIAVTPQSYHASQSTPSYAAGSTDGSSFSAYYKPSDNLDSSVSAEPLEQVLIEECRKLENTSTAQASYAYNKSQKKDIDQGHHQPLSVTDEKSGEATCETDFQVKVHVEKNMESDKVDEGKGNFLVGASSCAQSSKKQKQEKKMSKKSTIRSHRNSDKSKDTKITRKKMAGALAKKGSGLEDRSSKVCTSLRRRPRAVSGADNEIRDLEDKPPETLTLASFSAKKKARTVNKNHKGQAVFLDCTVLLEKHQWTKETTSSSVRDHGTSAMSKDANIAKKKRSGFPSKASGMEDNVSEMYTSARRKSRLVSGTANASDDFTSVSRKKKSSVADKRKARPLSGASKKSSDLEDESPETQMNLCEGVDSKIKDAVTQKCLDAAHLKLFGYTSPSDDSDFESSNDFGQSDVETKTVLSNDGNDDRCTEMKTMKELGTEQKERETVGQSSKLCSTYLGDCNTDVQQMMEHEGRDEVRGVSELSSRKEKSPSLPMSCHQAEMRDRHTDKTVNSELLSCHSNMPGIEISTEYVQPIGDSRKSSVHFTNDSVGTNSHTSLSAKNITMNNKIDEKKHYTVARLKDTVPSSMPENEVELEEKGGRTTFTPKSVSCSLESSRFIDNNPLCDDQDMDARNQFREKEGSLAKTALAVNTKLIRGTSGETTQAKKNSQMSVEAIADRLTREKTAVQAHSLTQPPAGQSLTEDSNSENSPAVCLSTDCESQSESISLSQVESRLEKLHGVAGVTSDILAAGSTPRSVHDVCRDLEQTPDKFQSVQSNVTLLPTGNKLEHERQELALKKQSGAGKKKCKNKKLRDLLGDDVSPIKISTEGKDVCKDREHRMFHKLLTATGKHNSPIKDNPDVGLEDTTIERSGICTAVNEIVQESKVISMQKEVCESDEIKTTDQSKFCDASTIEMTDAVDTVGSGMKGLPSQGKIMIYDRHQVSSNEEFIEIVYADEGPQKHNLVFEDITNFSLVFELDDHLDGGAGTYKCIISEFQELFCASPKQCTSRSESCESGQVDTKRRNTSVNCTNNRRLGCVTGGKERHKELCYEGKSVGLYPREHKTGSCSPHHKRSRGTSCDGMRTSHNHKSTEVYRRQRLSANPGRESQSLHHRSPPSCQLSVKSKVSTFSPLNELYNEFLKEGDSVKFGSHCNKRDRCFSSRSNEQLPFGHRGRGGERSYDRHINSQRAPVHSSSRESRCTSSSSSSSHGCNDKRSTREVKATEISSTKFLGDAAVLTGEHTAIKDTDQWSTTGDTQIKGVTHERQKVLDSDDSPEEGELIDEDSEQEFDEDKCNYDLSVSLQKYPSSVGNVQSEKLCEDTPRILKVNMNARNIASDQSVEQNRSVGDKPSQEPQKTQKKSVQKEGSFAGPSAGKALPPKKRKASSEELSVQVEKRMRTNSPQALLKRVDLDHLLDFVHGEKPG